MTDDTVMVFSSNEASRAYCGDSSGAFVRVQDVVECLGDTLWIVSLQPDPSAHHVRLHDDDLDSGATVTAPHGPATKCRPRLRALRRKLQDAGKANLDWDGIEQEKFARRGDVEDR